MLSPEELVASHTWGFTNPARAVINFQNLSHTLGSERYQQLIKQLHTLLPASADPDMGLNNLERLLAQPLAREKLPALLDPRGRGLEIVLTLLAASQFFADTLVNYPEAVEQVRTPPKRSPSTAELASMLRGEVEAAPDDLSVLRTFRRFRQTQTLRVGVNDIIRERPLEEITRELSRIADASIDLALATALKNIERKQGTPTAMDGQRARITCMAFGKLGGDELNYSSDIDLMFVYDSEGTTVGKRGGGIPNSEFFASVVAEVIRILSTHTDRGFAYRVDLRLRPEGNRGPLARSLASTLSYYDVSGRTWERQALIKIRHCGGDRDLGMEYLDAIESFVYRKYFSFAEINEVKALKRSMEQRATRAGHDDRDVKTGRGGIRDIEYTVQYLQLLNGGDIPAVRQRNTLLALEALEIAGCLTSQETYILADAYRFLRKVEHRLQLLFDWQTHRLPETEQELNTLARRMGYATQSTSTPLEQFQKDFKEKTEVDRTILDHLLHQTFVEPTDSAEPETDLIFQTDADEAQSRATLAKYGFKDIPRALRNLMQLARESVPFLSARRCRYFLASIAPQLLRAVAETPDPDEALNNLEQVTASLGAKAVLYELFSANPATLKLYVDLCAGSSFLSGLLINNPGMIDELLDSLVLDQPRLKADLQGELADLCRGANDLDPILHSFQDKELLRVGVRDLLSKDDIRGTTAALSDIAEVILNTVFDLHEPGVCARFGTPMNPDGTPLAYAVIGLGKLGGREMGYHSDLDLMIVVERDGATQGTANERTTVTQWVTELAQRAIKSLSQQGPRGRLYAVDFRLRPTGKSGALVVTADQLVDYIRSADCQLWERLALMRWRVVRGNSAFAFALTERVFAAAKLPYALPVAVRELLSMRAKLEAAAGKRSIKRGTGGLMDIEFIVQFCMANKHETDTLQFHPNVWDALDAMETAKQLLKDEVSILREGYTFLRFAESRLRIVTDHPLDEVPQDLQEREKFARRLGYVTEEKLRSEGERITHGVRAVFEKVFQRMINGV